jgi:hypothetical protein
MRKITTVLIVFVMGLVAFCPIQCVNGHSSDVFSAWATVTPTIDGVISLGEWDDADSITVKVSGQNGETHNLAVYVKNDATDLYIAIVVDDEYSDPAQPGYDFLNLVFDNDHDGVCEIGDDRLSIKFDGTVQDLYDPTGVQWSFPDTVDGGTNDIVGAITHTNPVPDGWGYYTAEYQHPLDTTDDAHDFSLSAGDTVGFYFMLADGDPHTGPTGSFSWPSDFPSGFADIVIAGPPPTAIIEFDPDTLNLKSKGQWISCYIELPKGYDLNNIDNDSQEILEINGKKVCIPVEKHPTGIGDHDTDGIPDLMVKFDRSEVEDNISPGDAVLTVAVKLIDGSKFESSAIIRTIDPGKK